MPLTEVKLKQVFTMLRFRAHGATWELKLHHYWVTFKGNTFTGLPKGPGGGADLEAKVKCGHIRKMIRALGIDADCAKNYVGC